MKNLFIILISILSYTIQAQCVNFTVTHDPTNGFIPVEKTINYKVVASDLCWLGQNLGAERTANFVWGGSDEAAGYYWQFNRALGSDGSGYIAGWEYLIMEQGGWMPENDPCQELGIDWRLPTYVEWKNIDDVNGWSQAKYVFQSPMKLHMSGFLYNSWGGKVRMRGNYGGFWSSTPGPSIYEWERAWAFQLRSGAAFVNIQDKSHGMSIRCVKNY